MGYSPLCDRSHTATCAGGLWYMINHSMSFSVGRCLVADNGSYMFIDGNSPIIMSNRKDKEGLFSGLGTGDKILIFHDGIADTYPAGPVRIGV